MNGMNYSQAGVNREQADRLVEDIVGLSKKTFGKHKKWIVGAIGGYASLYDLGGGRLLAASTDGVGTKLKLAIQLREHTTVGIDLVAMSVNDLLCVGAEPLLFLDYFATGKLDAEVARGVLAGITAGCQQAGCALVGGETAEMPDFYASGDYDLAGFAVGILKKKQLLPQKNIRPGDWILGLSSSGFHSNGYSLLRRLIGSGPADELLARELLNPTRIYVRDLASALEQGWIKGLAHITGSGFLNVPRMSTRVNYEIRLPRDSEIPQVIPQMRQRASLSLHEFASTFNCGVGMVAVVDPKNAKRVLKAVQRFKNKAWLLGEVIPRSVEQKSDSLVFVLDGTQRVALEY